MPQEYLPFHSFNDPAILNDFIEKLKQNGIDFKVEKTPALLDATLIGVASNDELIIKLRSEDFIKAHQCLGNYYKSEIDSIGKDYYLFGFKDDELFEILSKPDEWGYFDYQLAQRILADRGLHIDTTVLEKLKIKRKDELAKPEKAGLSSYVVAYFFIVVGLLGFLDPIFSHSDFSYLITIISFLIGGNIYKSKKTLPNGESVFSYPEKDRKKGRLIMYLSLIVIAGSVLKQLIAINSI